MRIFFAFILLSLLFLSSSCSVVLDTECSSEDDFCPAGRQCVRGQCVLAGGGCRDEDNDSFFAGEDCEGERDCDDTNEGINPSADELCDGVDNNCDGATDEGCPCEADDTQPCGNHGDEGDCQDGIQSCSGGLWGLCEGARGPVPEQCDGLDNNCDGDVDNDVTIIGMGCVVPGQTGLCAVGQIQCEQGDELCEAVSSATDELCNLIDDDCDGEIDEENPEGGGACRISGVDGPCQEGELQCTNGTLTCARTVIPEPEICNEVDDDCDGAIDNNFPSVPCTCTNGDTLSCGTTTGECNIGLRTCENEIWDVCEGDDYIGPIPEICDGLDNDCNGVPDDGNPGGGGECTVDSLDGRCAQGVQMCTGAAIVCTQVLFPTDETCNGVDDDCDGTVDDGNPGGGGSCVVAGELGACLLGEEQCIDGALTCAPAVTPTTDDSCGEGDTDCDGQIDEECTCLDGATTSCGLSDRGECLYGTLTCSGGSWGDCEGAVLPVIEECNGVDDDCDGLVDEGNPGGSEYCEANGEVGLCAEGTTRCFDGSILCDPAFPVREQCNGLDDSCDGSVDESGEYPEPDTYEFNESYLTSTYTGDFETTNLVSSPFSPTSFHHDADVDCFRWSFETATEDSTYHFQCRLINLAEGDVTHLWMGIGDAPINGHPNIRSQDNDGMRNLVAMSLQWVNENPPYLFWACVSPQSDDFGGPCHADYGIECRNSFSPTW